MLGVVLAFLSSIFWGGSDFAGGVASRRSTALHATLWSFAGGTVASLIAAVIWRGDASGRAVVAGAAAGVLAVGGFLALYASLAAAPMGVVTVIVGAAEAIIPVLVGVGWYHDALSGWAWLGVGLALGGAAMIGLAEGERGRAPWPPLILAAVSGALFGLSVVAFDAAPHDSGLVTPTVDVITGLVLVLVLQLVIARIGAMRRAATSIGITTGPSPREAYATRIALGAGVLMAAANITLLFALREGQLAVVGVVLCLYPIATALLARVFLKERLVLAQILGIAVALGGCVLLALF